MLKNAVECTRRRSAAEGRDRAHRGRARRKSGDLERWPPDRSRSRGRGGRHSSQYRARAQSRCSTSIAALSSTTGSKPPFPATTPSANAPSIAATATAWSSPPMSRRACSLALSRARRPPMPAAFSATNLKVSGVNVFSAGDFLGAAGTEQIVLPDPGLGTYKKLVIARRQTGRRRAVRRYRRRPLVSRPDPVRRADRPNSATISPSAARFAERKAA